MGKAPRVKRVKCPRIFGRLSEWRCRFWETTIRTNLRTSETLMVCREDMGSIKISTALKKLIPSPNLVNFSWYVWVLWIRLSISWTRTFFWRLYQGYRIFAVLLGVKFKVRKVLKYYLIRLLYVFTCDIITIVYFIWFSLTFTSYTNWNFVAVILWLQKYFLSLVNFRQIYFGIYSILNYNYVNAYC